MKNKSNITIFIVNDEDINGIEYSNFFKANNKDILDDYRRSVWIDGERIAETFELPYYKIETDSRIRIKELIQKIVNPLFFTRHGIEWNINYTYVIEHTVLPVFVGKRDIRAHLSRHEKFSEHEIKHYHNQTLSEFNIHNFEVLHLKEQEISRYSTENTGSTRAGAKACMDFPSTIYDFLSMVKESVSLSDELLQMILLYTDSDYEFSIFLRKYFADIHVLSSPNFNVYAIERVIRQRVSIEAINFWKSILSEKLYVLWSALGWLSRKPYDKTQCYEIATKLGIQTEQFPCIALFDPIKLDKIFVFGIVKPYIEFFRILFDQLNSLIGQNNTNRVQRYQLIQSDFIKIQTYISTKLQHLEETFMNNQVEKRKILFLGANPIDTDKLRIDEELRKIDDGLQAAKFRENFELVSKWAVKMETLTKAMLDNNPQIIHFAGHGEKKGIALEQEDGTTHIIPIEALKRLFRLFKDKVECVVLNACYSEEQAKAISENNIYVVGMNDRIGDRTAIDFSVGFYQSIGAGKDYEFAHQMGVTLLMSKNISQGDIPVMWKDGKRIEL